MPLHVTRDQIQEIRLLNNGIGQQMQVTIQPYSDHRHAKVTAQNTGIAAGAVYLTRGDLIQLADVLMQLAAQMKES